VAVNGSEPAFRFVGTERFCSVNDCCDGACNGAGSRIRTDDLLITNQLLYQLSYAGFTKACEKNHILAVAATLWFQNATAKLCFRISTWRSTTVQAAELTPNGT
jgi:hypothetical protein